MVIILSYSNLYSHPTKHLEEHLLNVAQNSENIFKSLCIKNKNLYMQISFLIGLSHDFAKSTTFFQEHLFGGKKTKKSHHAYLSAIFGFFVVNDYLNQNDIDSYLDLAILTYLIILKHHGNLQNIDGTNGELNKLKLKEDLARTQINDIEFNINSNIDYDLVNFYKKYDININDFFLNFNEIFDEIEEGLEELTFNEDNGLDNYIYLILFYSVLLDSDKIDASETNLYYRNDISSNLVDKFKEEEFKDKSSEINKIREEAYLEVINKVDSIDLNQKIYSIDLPTGAGKTLTAFSFALKLKERITSELGFNPRIIYSLPFLSVIDQNEKVISNILSKYCFNGSNILLKHHHLADMTFKVDEEKELDLNNSKILIEGWHSEIIITTFIQFFYSLISNKNRSLRKFHNMANSIIILDEIQAVPQEYWLVINNILKKLAYEFNTFIILMTATQPLIFNENKHEIIPLIENKMKYYGSFDRVDYNFNVENINFQDFESQIISEIVKNDSKDMMFVLNTIDSSKNLYHSIRSYFDENYVDIYVDKNNGICYIGDKIQLIYLSTNIIPKHRLERISEINKPNKRTIVVSTQLIEAGVDISVDIIYRDLAPLDSIIQTAGRCNRNNSSQKGEINIVSLVNEKNRRFSSFIYNSVLINSTLDLLKNKFTCSEKDFNLSATVKYNEFISKRKSKEKSKHLLNDLNQLNFSEISNEFKLMGDDFDKIDVFVIFDEMAQELWDLFNEFKEISNPFERKNKFLTIKSDFYSYVVSVNNKNKNVGSAQIENENLAYLLFEDLDRKYDLETGFLYQKDENPFIL